MIAPAVFFLAALCMFLICIVLSMLLVAFGEDNSKWWEHLMRWIRVSVAMGVITGILTLITLVFL